MFHLPGGLLGFDMPRRVMISMVIGRSIKAATTSKKWMYWITVEFFDGTIELVKWNDVFGLKYPSEI